MIDRHLDSVRSYTVAAYNVIAVAISHTTTIAWLQIISLGIGILVGVVTLIEKWQRWKQDKEKLPIIVLLATLLVSGCAAPKISHHAVKGAQRVEAAELHIGKAKAASARATQGVATAKEALSILKRTATPTQLPAVGTLETALLSVGREARIMRNSLDAALPQLVAAQGSINSLGVQLLKARQDAQGYRRLKLWLSLFVGAGAVYVAFRLVPAVSGPFRFYASGASGVVATSLTYFIL